MSWRDSLGGGNGGNGGGGGRGKGKKPRAFGVGGDQNAVGGPFNRAFNPKETPIQQRRVKVHHTTGFKTAAPLVASPSYQFRTVAALFGLTLMFAAVGTRLAYVGLMPAVEPRVSIRELPVEPGRRGNIYDRNGILLGATLKVYSLYVDPKRLLDRDEAVRKLHAAFPELRKEWLANAFGDPDRRFVWLKRRMTPNEAQRAIALGLPGLNFREEFIRVYPHQNTASHIMGGVDVDNNGLAGVERSYDKSLRKGDDLTLAIDIRMQDLMRQSVVEAVTKTGSKAGWGVVMDAKTGELLALTSQPDYDPNHFGKASDEQRFNRAVLASYEMGSTFKLFTLAQGLNDGVITPDSPIDCRGYLHIGRFTIKDSHAKNRILTATEVLRYSSNIGAAKIADLSGPELQKQFMSRMGMLQPLNVGLAEVGPVRYPSNWGRVQTFTVSFGHGIMVTPLHVVAAVGALVTDGHYRPPHIVKGGQLPTQLPEVMKPHTIEQMRTLMRDVVVNGSGRSAQVPGYDIGGKTGTAEKASGGGYDHSKNVVSFVAALPLNDPKYIVLIMLDEPMKQFSLAGLSATPAVGKFIQRSGLVAGLQPDMVQVDMARAYLAKQAARNGGRSVIRKAALLPAAATSATVAQGPVTGALGAAAPAAAGQD